MGTELMQVDEFTGLRVRTEQFEGPLDLLLHLIRRHELDICEVSLTRIADQYLEAVNSMELLNIDLAGEFIHVAATLIWLKSKALLPSDGAPAEELDEEIESPAELIRRLLLYKKYKEGADQLRQRNRLFDSVFVRTVEEPILDMFRETNVTLDVSVYQLIEAFQSILKRSTTKKVHEVHGEHFPLGQRVREVWKVLRSRRDVSFEELFVDDSRRQWLIVTFLAILEIARLGMVRIYQPETQQPIRLTYLENPQAEHRIETLVSQAEERFQYGRPAAPAPNAESIPVPGPEGEPA